MLLKSVTSNQIYVCMVWIIRLYRYFVSWFNFFASHNRYCHRGAYALIQKSGPVLYEANINFIVSKRPSFVRWLLLANSRKWVSFELICLFSLSLSLLRNQLQSNLKKNYSTFKMQNFPLASNLIKKYSKNSSFQLYNCF